MNKPKLAAAIAYFEDAIRESDEIIAECSPGLQAELTEQKAHFVVALEAMRAPLPDNKALTCDGCMYKLREGWNYEHCVRCARHWPDSYRRPPEKEE